MNNACVNSNRGDDHELCLSPPRLGWRLIEYVLCVWPRFNRRADIVDLNGTKKGKKGNGKLMKLELKFISETYFAFI